MNEYKHPKSAYNYLLKKTLSGELKWQEFIHIRQGGYSCGDFKIFGSLSNYFWDPKRRYITEVWYKDISFIVLHEGPPLHQIVKKSIKDHENQIIQQNKIKSIEDLNNLIAPDFID